MGGQAVLEGVMMRGAATWAVAVRDPEGEIRVDVHDVPGWSERYRHIPVLRGVMGLAESLGLGRPGADSDRRTVLELLEKLPSGPGGSSGETLEADREVFEVVVARHDVTGLTEEALLALEAYDWPGNIRELRNVVERGVALCPGSQVAPQPGCDQVLVDSVVLQRR